MSKIQNWFDQRGTYIQGVELLMEFAPSSPLTKYLQGTVENSFNLEKLKLQLKTILKAETPVEMPAEIIPISIGSALSAPKLEQPKFENLTEEGQQLRLMRNDLVRQADILKERLRHLPTREERRIAGIQVLNLWRDVHVLHLRIDSIGKPPVATVEEIKPASMEELKKQLQKAYVNRSKAKDKNPIRYSRYDAQVRSLQEQIAQCKKT